MVQQARDESSSPSQPSGSRHTKTKTVAGGNAKEGYSSSKKSKAGGKTSSAVSDDDDEDGEDESQDESSTMYQNGMMPPMHPYGFYPPWLFA